MSTAVHFRKAEKNDVVAIVGMLAEDPLGSSRERYETPLPQSYYDAFEAIDSDSNHELVVATVDGETVGVMQLTYIPFLTYRGGWRAQIEGVRVATEFPGNLISNETAGLTPVPS